MRKILFFAIVLSLVLLFGCIGTSESGGSSTKKTEYEQMTVSAGQKINVVVQAKTPYKGYDWDFEIANKSVLEYWDHKEEQCSTGQESCKETFTFYTLKPGKTTIWMMYHIPVAAGTIIEEKIVTVTVK